MSGAIEKAKRIAAEEAARIARSALEKIANGHSRNPEEDAQDALDRMWQSGKKQPLQGLVGHARHRGTAG
jgi:hypothetical protein